MEAGRGRVDEVRREEVVLLAVVVDFGGAAGATPSSPLSPFLLSLSLSLSLLEDELSSSSSLTAAAAAAEVVAGEGARGLEVDGLRTDVETGRVTAGDSERGTEVDEEDEEAVKEGRRRTGVAPLVAAGGCAFSCCTCFCAA